MDTDTEQRFLLVGGGGWICGQLEELLESQGKQCHVTRVRMEDMNGMRQVFQDVKPTRVINCAGKTGRPNVDWCETNRVETVRSNVIGTLMLADLCEEMSVHMTNLATGCIYESTYTPDSHTLLSAPIPETAPANFSASFYSFTKSRVEEILTATHPSVLTLRIRMPISDDLHPRSFVTKITKYSHVVDIPNSNTILHDLLPVVIAMAEHREEGVYNFTNPGAISHNEVLTLYRDIVDPGFEWKNFSLEEQGKILAAGRSNCELDVGKLMGVVKRYQSEGVEVDVPEIHRAYEACFRRMKARMDTDSGAAMG